MKKTLYSKKFNAKITIPRKLYKKLSKVMNKDQIGEFNISFNLFNQNEDFTIKNVISNLTAFYMLMDSDTLLDELNNNTDKEGNVDWPNLLCKYKENSDFSIIYI